MIKGIILCGIRACITKVKHLMCVNWNFTLIIIVYTHSVSTFSLDYIISLSLINTEVLLSVQMASIGTHYACKTHVLTMCMYIFKTIINFYFQE